MKTFSHYPRISRWVFLVALLVTIGGKANAQFYAVKVDALGLLTTTLNVEGAMVIHNRWSLHLPIKVSPWKFSGKAYQHTTTMPGARYWFTDSYSRGWFLGVNAVVTAYNFTGLVGDRVDYFARDYRYKGWGYGGGISGGFSLPISKRWNIEFELGVNAAYLGHDIYNDLRQTDRVGFQQGILFVPGKIAANLVYLF